jgi:FixJ family two-component response regulator
MHEVQLGIDDDRAAALEIILLLADAEARWRQYERALDLLHEAENAGCILSPEYRMKRHEWDRALARA